MTVRKHDIIELFGKYGDIIEIMMKDDFAFVEYAHIQSAAKALNELNGQRLGPQKIQVEEARPKEGDAANAPPPKHLRNQGNALSSRRAAAKYSITQILGSLKL